MSTENDARDYSDFPGIGGWGIEKGRGGGTLISAELFRQSAIPLESMVDDAVTFVPPLTFREASGLEKATSSEQVREWIANALFLRDIKVYKWPEDPPIWLRVEDLKAYLGWTD